ncbi:MAG: tRNA uridine-5-carboxymethylaminomethyl(34) synthesis enzyme MnmG, partial [Proteobacteria bacterium]
YLSLMSLVPEHQPVDDQAVIEQLGIDARYNGYLERQNEEIARRRRHEDTTLPEDIDYDEVQGLSSEVRQKLAEARPATVGQAGRLSGVTPAAVSLLLVHLKKRAMLAA